MAPFQRYQDVQVGDSFPPVPMNFDVAPETVAAFCAATGDTRDRRDTNAAPSMLAAVYLIELLKSRQSPPGGIHAKQSFRFHRKLRVGETLALLGTVKEKYVRKDRRYVVSDFEAHDTSGGLVASGTITSIWGQDA